MNVDWYPIPDFLLEQVKELLAEHGFEFQRRYSYDDSYWSLRDTRMERP